MAVALLVFTAHKDSFSVFIKNLEELSVEQIQEIQNFVQYRNGFFDFNSYSFVIQKNINFSEFVKLIDNSSIEANCIQKDIVLQEKQRIGFGQYKGLFYDELSISYLLWLKGNYNGKDKNIIEKELKKRNM